MARFKTAQDFVFYLETTQEDLTEAGGDSVSEKVKTEIYATNVAIEKLLVEIERAD